MRRREALTFRERRRFKRLVWAYDQLPAFDPHAPSPATDTSPDDPATTARPGRDRPSDDAA